MNGSSKMSLMPSPNAASSAIGGSSASSSPKCFTSPSYSDLKGSASASASEVGPSVTLSGEGFSVSSHPTYMMTKAASGSPAVSLVASNAYTSPFFLARFASTTSTASNTPTSVTCIDQSPLDVPSLCLPDAAASTFASDSTSSFSWAALKGCPIALSDESFRFGEKKTMEEKGEKKKDEKEGKEEEKKVEKNDKGKEVEREVEKEILPMSLSVPPSPAFSVLHPSALTKTEAVDEKPKDSGSSFSRSDAFLLSSGPLLMSSASSCRPHQSSSSSCGMTLRSVTRLLSSSSSSSFSVSSSSFPNSSSFLPAYGGDGGRSSPSVTFVSSASVQGMSIDSRLSVPPLSSAVIVPDIRSEERVGGASPERLTREFVKREGLNIDDAQPPSSLLLNSPGQTHVNDRLRGMSSHHPDDGYSASCSYPSSFSSTSSSSSSFSFAGPQCNLGGFVQSSAASSQSPSDINAYVESASGRPLATLSSYLTGRRGGRSRKKRTKYDVAYRQMEKLAEFSVEAQKIDVSTLEPTSVPYELLIDPQGFAYDRWQEGFSIRLGADGRRLLLRKLRAIHGSDPDYWGSLLKENYLDMKNVFTMATIPQLFKIAYLMGSEAWDFALKCACFTNRCAALLKKDLEDTSDEIEDEERGGEVEKGSRSNVPRKGEERRGIGGRPCEGDGGKGGEKELQLADSKHRQVRGTPSSPSQPSSTSSQGSCGAKIALMMEEEEVERRGVPREEKKRRPSIESYDFLLARKLSSSSVALSTSQVDNSSTSTASSGGSALSSFVDPLSRRKRCRPKYLEEAEEGEEEGKSDIFASPSSISSPLRQRRAPNLSLRKSQSSPLPSLPSSSAGRRRSQTLRGRRTTSNVASKRPLNVSKPLLVSCDYSGERSTALYYSPSAGYYYEYLPFSSTRLSTSSLSSSTSAESLSFLSRCGGGATSVSSTSSVSSFSAMPALGGFDDFAAVSRGPKFLNSMSSSSSHGSRLSAVVTPSGFLEATFSSHELAQDSTSSEVFLAGLTKPVVSSPSGRWRQRFARGSDELLRRGESIAVDVQEGQASLSPSLSFGSLSVGDSSGSTSLGVGKGVRASTADALTLSKRLPARPREGLVSSAGEQRTASQGFSSSPSTSWERNREGRRGSWTMVNRKDVSGRAERSRSRPPPFGGEEGSWKGRGSLMMSSEAYHTSPSTCSEIPSEIKDADRKTFTAPYNTSTSVYLPRSPVSLSSSSAALQDQKDSLTATGALDEDLSVEAKAFDEFLEHLREVKLSRQQRRAALASAISQPGQMSSSSSEVSSFLSEISTDVKWSLLTKTHGIPARARRIAAMAKAMRHHPNRRRLPMLQSQSAPGSLGVLEENVEPTATSPSQSTMVEANSSLELSGLHELFKQSPSSAEICTSVSSKVSPSVSVPPSVFSSSATLSSTSVCDESSAAAAVATANQLAALAKSVVRSDKCVQTELCCIPEEESLVNIKTNLQEWATQYSLTTQYLQAVSMLELQYQMLRQLSSLESTLTDKEPLPLDSSLCLTGTPGANESVTYYSGQTSASQSPLTTHGVSSSPSAVGPQFDLCHGTFQSSPSQVISHFSPLAIPGSSPRYMPSQCMPNNTMSHFSPSNTSSHSSPSLVISHFSPSQPASRASFVQATTHSSCYSTSDSKESSSIAAKQAVIPDCASGSSIVPLPGASEPREVSPSLLIPQLPACHSFLPIFLSFFTSEVFDSPASLSTADSSSFHHNASCRSRSLPSSPDEHIPQQMPASQFTFPARPILASSAPSTFHSFFSLPVPIAASTGPPSYSSSSSVIPKATATFLPEVPMWPCFPS